MRALREDERDEIEALKHLIKYVNTKHNVESFKVWDAFSQLNEIAKKYVLTEIVTEEELNELLDLDDIQELVEKLFIRIKDSTETGKYNE